jgi:uncharacterized protein
MKRFYPDCLPVFPNEPSPKQFAIRKIGDGVGEGVVALAEFRKGELLFAFTGFIVPEITQYSLKLTDEQHIHDPYFMGKVLHSCQPNAYCDMERRRFVALEQILIGDLITMDYAQTEDVLFKPFTCRCGAANCRKYICGKQEALVTVPGV